MNRQNVKFYFQNSEKLAVSSSFSLLPVLAVCTVSDTALSPKVMRCMAAL